MKIEITCLVVRGPRGLYQVLPIAGDDTDVQIVYPNQDVTLAALSDKLIYLTNAELGQVIRDYTNGQDVRVSDYAGRLPSIGEVKVSIETRNLEWTA